MSVAERHVLIDPYVLAVPNDPATIGAYVSGLLTWLPVLSTQRNECSCFQSALPILLEEGRFPTHDTLAPLFARAAAQEFSLVDLLQMIRVIAATEPFFEHFIDRRAAAATEIVIVPATILQRLGERLGAATREALVLTAVAHDRGWCSHRTYWATSIWNEPDEWITASANVSLVELLSGDIEAFDRGVQGRLKVLTATAEVAFGGSIADTYQSPASAVALVLHRLRQFDAQIPDAVVVSAGDQFVSSLEEHNLQAQQAILETVFERAAFAAIGRLHEIAGAKLHPVRTTQAADSPQVERADGAKLWRCMVTKAGAGYRLHYWSLPGGGVELDEILVESVV